MAFVEGAAVGGEIGLAGGPVGAAAGAVIGGLIGLGAGLLLAKAVETANSDASTSLSDHPVSQACADCGDGPDCFEPPKGADPAEFADQLQDQQDEINKLSPDQMLDRLSEGDVRKDATKSYRGPGDSTVRERTRAEVADSAGRQAFDDTLKSNGSVAEADQADAAARREALLGKDATHSLDWVAGGDGKMSGVGDRSINRSIGSQWRHAKPGSRFTRREQLRKAAQKAKDQGKTKMDTKLKEC